MSNPSIPDFGIPSTNRTQAAETLQSTLADLAALALYLKQAHWNLTGPQFRSVHEQLDEFVVPVRDHIDAVAERIVTLGFPADGRPETIAETHRLDPLPGGRFDVAQVVEMLSAAMSKTIRNAREPLSKLGEVDPVSEDLVIGMLADLEKYEWMLRAQIER